MAKGYVVTHTHWDREWRYPIWESRLYLAEMIDELLDILDTQPGYNSFLLDGQSVLLEDYLLLRPENKQRILERILDGRLIIGPWYTLPDLYPISGESIVRNLLKGDRVCREYGKKLSIGYESFGWGKPSQMPQIYRGFGIDTVIVAKNISKQRAPQSEFIWEGKDGTRLLTTRLGNEARSNFFMHTYIDAMSGRKYKSDDFRYQNGKECFYHRSGKISSEQDFFKLTHTDVIHKEHLRDMAMQSWNAVDDTVMKDHRLIMDGSDSTTAQPQLLDLINAINQETAGDDIVFEHASLDEYIRLLNKTIDRDSLTLITGELRDGPAPAVSGNALMTRIPIKQNNKLAQVMLMDVAEPLAAAGSLLGMGYNKNYLDRAMEYLLLSHSHDSINGVTQDKTANDIMYRLAQVCEIADCVKEQFMRQLALRVAPSSCTKADVLVMLVNPLPFARREILTLVVDTPADDNIWSFTFRDTQGNPIFTSHLARKETVTPVVSLYSRPEPYYADRHTVLVDSGEIPAGGYKVLRLSDAEHFVRKQKFWAATRMSDGRELASSATHMENERISVEVLSDGSVLLADKVTGYLSGPMNYFESTGDVGDYWTHYPPYNNQICTSKGAHARIWLEENTPLQASIHVAFDFMLPAFCERPENGVQGNSSRHTSLKASQVTIRYTLKKNAPILEVRTTIANTVEDHMMSVKFDTGIKADFADAQGHFCVDHRPVLPMKDTNGKYFNELCTLPMQNFVDVSDGSNGFGLISTELGEYDASVPGTLSCTLFRAVRNIICTEFRSESNYESQKGGQLQQLLNFSYALMLHSGNWENSNIHEAARCFNVPVMSAQFSMTESSESLSGCGSFYSVENVTVSAIKKTEDRDTLLFRVYNPYSKEETAVIRTIRPIATAWITDMNENRRQEILAVDGILSYVVEPDKIITFEVAFE